MFQKQMPNIWWLQLLRREYLLYLYLTIFRNNIVCMLSQVTCDTILTLKCNAKSKSALKWWLKCHKNDAWKQRRLHYKQSTRLHTPKSHHSFSTGLFLVLEEFLLSEHITIISHAEVWAIKSKNTNKTVLHSQDLIHQFLCRHLPPLYPKLVCVALKLTLHH